MTSSDLTPTPPAPSRDNEPPEGMWVMDRFGASHERGPDGGWGTPGFFYFGKWTAMWDARGPLTLCGRYGAALDPVSGVFPTPSDPYACEHCGETTPMGPHAATCPEVVNGTAHPDTLPTTPKGDREALDFARKLREDAAGWDEAAKPLTGRQYFSFAGAARMMRTAAEHIEALAKGSPEHAAAAANTKSGRTTLIEAVTRLLIRYEQLEDFGAQEFADALLAAGLAVTPNPEAMRMLGQRLQVAEAIISRAREAMREEFDRSQVKLILNNPLPPMPDLWAVTPNGEQAAPVETPEVEDVEEDGYPYNFNNEQHIEAVCRHCGEPIQKNNGAWWHDGTGPCYTFSGRDIGHPAGEPDYTREWAAPEPRAASYRAANVEQDRTDG